MKSRVTLTRLLSALAVSLWVLLAAPPQASAQSLQELKQAGVVGEQVDGYLGIVSGEIDAPSRTLVERINAERRDAYARIAAGQGVEVEQVAALAGAKLVAAAPSGQYVRDSTGEWKQK